MSKKMAFFEHMQELMDRFVRVAAVVAVIGLFVFTFRIQHFKFRESMIPLPFPDPFRNLASQLIDRIKIDLLPEYVNIVVISPSQAIISQIYVTIFIALVASMPYLVYQIIAFVSPALYSHEKKLVGKLVIPATILFLLGAIFAYTYVTPFSIDFLYRYAIPLGAETFITIDGLISFVLRFVFGFGIAFQLPIFMWALTRAQIVGIDFWKDNIRYAFVAMVIFGAVITPDGSGVTMWLVAAPMMTLYLLGFWFIRRDKRNTNNLPVEIPQD